MKIAVPCETKVLEGRIALTPAAVRELVKSGHQVNVQSNAGLLSGYPNQEYLDAGASMIESAEDLYASSKLIVKVKEPQLSEIAYFNREHILFSFLHLAAAPSLTSELQKIGLTAVAFETVEENNFLPILAPMSDIAGRISVQIGTHLLHQPQRGRGILLGGVTGSEKGQVVILGGGTAGTAATQIASALGANVIVFDPSRDKQIQLESIGQNVTACQPLEQDIKQAVKSADLLIGAVLIPGAKAPHLVSDDLVKKMKSGSVIIDISVDQGGCIASTKPTTYDSPTFMYHDVVHFGVTNMPGAVPRTATQALSAVLLPYVMQICDDNWESNSALAGGINLKKGEIILPTLR